MKKISSNLLGATSIYRKMQPLVSNKYTVTVGDETMEPIKSGVCLLDKIDGESEYMTKIRLTLSKQLQQVHIENANATTKLNNESEKTERKRAIMNTGKTYELALAHSDRCWSRRFVQKDLGKETDYTSGLIRLASCMVL